jgi:predicted nucleic-acid-binding protein
MKITLHLTILILAIALRTSNCYAQELFNFEPDERIFTVYALMNGAGFSHDNLTPHDIRLEVTNYLDTTLSPEIKDKIKRFYYSHGYQNDSVVQFWHYTRYLLWLSPPPEFNILCDTCHFTHIKWAGFDSLIREFYNSANINYLFESYYNRLKNENLKYKPYADSALNCITRFCRLPKTYYEEIADEIRFNVNPLMSSWTAQTENINGVIYLINGPAAETDTPSIKAFLHEPLHHVVNPIVNNDSIYVDKTQVLYDYALKNGLKKSNAYSYWEYVVIESYVRFLTHYINYLFNTHDIQELEKKIKGDYNLGFLLVPYIYEQIDKYSKTSMDLNDFYMKLMSEMDIEKEKKRFMVTFNRD